MRRKKQTINCLKNTLLITDVQKICTNYTRQKVQEMRTDNI